MTDDYREPGTGSLIDYDDFLFTCLEMIMMIQF
jgi:hypothetical protein